ncbi:S-layer homology domain-containing protein [Paenibacillus daejeonensis]|uniref:S-layer homology domain-containing protein n=1 Tax=Paenibacillus daejeonensis TaxID=135193 RepID=UPI00035EE942|nr:S-layer homology domain-containing protein [Paenibacillus daejeonensis]
MRMGRASRQPLAFVLVIALLLGAVAPAWGAWNGTAMAAGDNLMMNGDFETGDLGGWNAGGNDKFKVNDQVVHGGSYALEIGGPQHWNGIKSTVSVKPDTDYTLTFYGRGAGGAAYKVLQASDEATLAENYTGAHTDWNLYTLPFNSGSNTAIIVYISDAGGVAYYDDFFIGGGLIETDVPEASGALIAGDARVTGILTGSFDYIHAGGKAEGHSMYQWLQADTMDGEFTPIPRGWGKTFTLTDSQEGKYVQLKVTPVDVSGVAGKELVSATTIGPITKAEANDRLGLRLREAQTELASAIAGDEYGQYPQEAIDSFTSVVSANERGYNNGSGTNEDVEQLEAAMNTFEEARVKKASAFERFITAEGTKLMDGSEELRFVSFNYPGALYNEDEEGGIMPTTFEQEDAIRTAVQTGGKVLRTYTLTVRDKADSPDKLRHIDGPGMLNDEAFRSMDKLLELANEHGVRLIIPFIDNWDWPPGGITDFAHFRGKERMDFYTDPQLIEDFKLVIEQVMNRVNTYTGVRYKDDPAILAWETGNELMVAPAWMSEIAAFYKSVNTKQLLVSGNQMELPHFYRNITLEALADPNIDIVKSHYYEGNYTNHVRSDKALATASGKPFFVGEFGFKPTTEVVSMLDEVISGGTSGALIWSLRPHSAKGGFIRHSEYEVGGILYRAYHWPGMPSGDYQDATNLLQVVYNKAYQIQGSAVPPMPIPTPAPVLLDTDSVTRLGWLGSTGASSYTVERAEQVSGPWTVIGTGVLDDVEPGENMFADMTAVTGKPYYYRVKGLNVSGESPYSQPLGPITAQYVLEDDRSDESRVYYSEPGAVVYRTPSAIKDVEVTASVSGTGAFGFQVSDDGITYEEVEPERSGNHYSWQAPAGSSFNHLKIIYPNQSTTDGTLSRVVIEYVGDGSTLTPVQPLLTSGVLNDRMDHFNAIFYREGNLTFETENPELYGGDASRLVREDAGEAFVVYRTQGEMKALKLEGYYASEPGAAGSFRFYGSADGSDYTELDAETLHLGGDRYKANSKIATFPEGIKFLKIVFPETGSPQISNVQIAVGTGTISLPSELPSHIIDAGDHYGGEELLLRQAYRTAPEGQVQLGLDSEIKSSGDYSLRVDFTLGSAGRAGITKALDSTDRSRYDTLQLWVRSDNQERVLRVVLKDSSGREWTQQSTITSMQGDYLSLPLNSEQVNLSELEEFSLYVQGGPSQGFIHLDDIRFTQTRVIDDFEGYTGNESAFAARYGNRNTGGGAISAALTSEVKGGGEYAMRIDYDMTGPGYAGLITQLPHADWSQYKGLQMWLHPGPASHNLSIQLRTGDGEYMETTFEVVGGAEAKIIEIPFSDFDYPSWYGGSGTLNPKEILEFNIYTGLIDEPAGYFYLDDIQLTGRKDTEPNPNPNPNPNPQNPGTEPENPGTGPGADEDTLSIDDPTIISEGYLVVDLSGRSKLTLPAGAEALGQAKALIVNGDGYSLTIAGEALRRIQQSLGSTALSDSQIYLAMEAPPEADIWLAKASQVNSVDLDLAGKAYSLRIGYIGSDGQERPVDHLVGDNTLAYELGEKVDRDVAGIYLVDAAGVLRYERGTLSDQRITIPIHQVGTYAPLEYRKIFMDVPSTHWAADVITKVAAQHIIQGVSATEYAPSRSVTRAEFAAMLVRALGLSASNAASFTDVDTGKWYAEAIAAASEAGIITGRTTQTFAPEATITREEMAVMVVRAYAYMLGEGTLMQTTVSFADAGDISEWAAQAVERARHLGLVQGKGDNRFDPKGSQLRSESAQVIWNLLTQ